MATMLDSAAQRLRDNPLPLLRSLDVIEDDDEVVISGRVNSYFEKQLAQEAIMPVLGPRRLRNMLIVARL